MDEVVPTLLWKRPDEVEARLLDNSYAPPEFPVLDPVDPNTNYNVEQIRELLYDEQRSWIVGGDERVERATVGDIRRMFYFLLAMDQVEFLDDDACSHYNGLNGTGIETRHGHQAEAWQVDQRKHTSIDDWAKPLLRQYHTAMGTVSLVGSETMDLLELRLLMDVVVEFVAELGEMATGIGAGAPGSSDEDLDDWIVRSGQEAVAAMVAILLAQSVQQDDTNSALRYAGQKKRDSAVELDRMEVWSEPEAQKAVETDITDCDTMDCDVTNDQC